MAATRWTLGQLLGYLRTRRGWQHVRTPSGLWRLLTRLGLSWKRARDHIHSPDPDYAAKTVLVRRRLDWARAIARAEPERPHIVTLLLDELTIYRQPRLAAAWGVCGAGPHDQPRAERSVRRDTQARIIATLDAVTAQVVYARWAQLSVVRLVTFYQQVCAAYPDARRIYLVQDNWPLHAHPDVLAALEPQASSWPWYRPAQWPTTPSAAALARWGTWQLPIQLVRLPTYASWLNPIEKLWRWLQQDVLRLHRQADAWEALGARVGRFLDQFAHGSAPLLHYVGLDVPA